MPADRAAHDDNPDDPLPIGASDAVFVSRHWAVVPVVFRDKSVCLSQGYGAEFQFSLVYHIFIPSCCSKISCSARSSPRASLGSAATSSKESPRESKASSAVPV